MVATLLPLAALGEIVGYRRIYLGGTILFALASLACVYRSEAWRFRFSHVEWSQWPRNSKFGVSPDTNDARSTRKAVEEEFG